MLYQLTSPLFRQILPQSGAHPDSFPVFTGKSDIIKLLVTHVRTPAANILKQELLGLGGDAVTPKGTITCQTDYVDIILLGTSRQYKFLCAKLALMSFFGLEILKNEIEKILLPCTPRTILADGRELCYDRTLIMGIINVTPDSFYSASRVDMGSIFSRVETMRQQGADIIDIGAESTRPGCVAITAQEELDRLVPVMTEVRTRFPDIVLSIDTRHSIVAARALADGADIINDVSANADSKITDVVSQYNGVYILTCNQGGTCADVCRWLAGKTGQLDFPREKLIWDPGIGFGKTAEENLEIIRDSSMLTKYGYPVLLGTSRKSCIGSILDLPCCDRLEGTLVTTVIAVQNGINLLRVHDVKENLRAVKMAGALK